MNSTEQKQFKLNNVKKMTGKVLDVKQRRLSTKLDCSSPKLTDQSYAKSADINNIMKQYSKTKVLPSVKEHLARYVDNTLAVPIETAYNMVFEAQEMFKSLPSDVRKLMDNDPTKMLDVLNNPDHKELLVKRGVLADTKIVTEDKEVLPPSGNGAQSAPKSE